MDLRTREGGRVSWDKVREWHGRIVCSLNIISLGYIPKRGRSMKPGVNMSHEKRMGQNMMYIAKLSFKNVGNCLFHSILKY